tara:strand:- start:932 stop:1402 length:471 start_codon:yes stop_codon:yes gene_type:complete
MVQRLRLGLIRQQLRLKATPAATLQTRAASALIAGHVGTSQFLMFHTVNTKMFVFKHPKFYEEFRQRSKRAQKNNPSLKQQATSVKQQASSWIDKPQAASRKRQTASHKLKYQSLKIFLYQYNQNNLEQGPSPLRQDSGCSFPHKVLEACNRRLQL